MFLHREDVPFDNNASERNLRRCKGETRQSGGFRSMGNGREPYCDYLTLTQTAKLRGVSPYGAVLAVFSGREGVLGGAAGDGARNACGEGLSIEGVDPTYDGCEL